MVSKIQSRAPEFAPIKRLQQTKTDVIRAPDLRQFQTSRLTSSGLSGSEVEAIFEYLIRDLPDVCRVLELRLHKTQRVAYTEVQYLTKVVEQCAEFKKPFVFIRLTLCCWNGDAHENALIIDTRRKTIERLEPNGSAAEFSAFADDVLSHAFQTVLPNYKYLTVKQSCPYLGPQFKQKNLPMGGFCAVWTILILHLKMLNLDWNIMQLSTYLADTFTPDELLTLITKYLTLLYQILQWEHKFRRLKVEEARKKAPRIAKRYDELSGMVSTAETLPPAEIEKLESEIGAEWRQVEKQWEEIQKDPASIRSAWEQVEKPIILSTQRLLMDGYSQYYG